MTLHWKETSLMVCLLALGVIHALPSIGVFGPIHLQKLYGIGIADPNVELALRHRAVFFAMIAALQFIAIFKPAFRTLAFAAAFVSLASFLWLAAHVGNHNSHFARVVMIDWAAVLIAFLGLFLHWHALKKSSDTAN